MMPTLSIGMACYDDFAGVHMTLQSLRLHHPEAIGRCEIIVVDNNPTSAQGRQTANLCNWGPGPAHSLRYIAAPEIQGTTAPRQRIFDEAQAPAVLVLDCHVMLPPGALARLLEYYATHPECRDLLSGPIVYDNLKSINTHFDDRWRDGMWGVWGTDPRGLDPAGEPFEIPAMGLGLFSCRRDAWPGFNAHFREFGGEEWYIHEKFRRGGARCVCLPWLRWWHRFGDPPGGRVYQRTNGAMFRNYILGHLELGLPLDRLRRHAVEGLNEDPDQPHSAQTKVPADWFERTVDECRALLGLSSGQPPATAPPSLARRAWNFAAAVTRHTVDGWAKVPADVYESRLKECEACPLRVDSTCTHESCGCPIEKKASWRSEACPLGKWGRALLEQPVVTPELERAIEAHKQQLAAQPAESARDFRRCPHTSFKSNVRIDRRQSESDLTFEATLAVHCELCRAQFHFPELAAYSPTLKIEPPVLTQLVPVHQDPRGGCGSCGGPRAHTAAAPD